MANPPSLLRCRRVSAVALDSQEDSFSFYFESKPLRDVLPEIGRRYNVKFALASDTLGERDLTASIRDESLDQLLRLLEATLELQITQTGPDSYLVQAAR